MEGDFNVMHFPEDRNREGRITGPMRKFSLIVDELELKDLPLQGGSFHVEGRVEQQENAYAG